MASAVNIFVAYKFIKQLATPWEDWEAFKLGLIDDNGKKLKNASTPEEKSAYPIWMILIRNIKRVLDKLPFGRSKLGSFAAALFLLKESLEMEDGTELYEAFEAYMQKSSYIIESEDLSEKINTVPKGKYIHTESDKMIMVSKDTPCIEVVFGCPIFKLHDSITGNDFVVTEEDLETF